MNYPEETATGTVTAKSKDEFGSSSSTKNRSKQSTAEARRKLENYLADRALEKNIRDVYDEYDF